MPSFKGESFKTNISLAQEICGELNFGSHNKALCVKIDLKKAFDYVNRSMLLSRLH